MGYGRKGQSVPMHMQSVKWFAHLLSGAEVYTVVVLFPLYPMMNGFGFFPAIGFLFLWGIHVLASFAGIVGLILLIGWALKHAPARTVKHWALWLIGIGLVLSLLTTPSMFGGQGVMMGGRFGSDEKGQGGLRNNSFREWMMGDDADEALPTSGASSSAR